MAMTINTNIISINAQRNLGLSGASLGTTMQRLSSGLRVNSAKDDAAGLAIAERMNGQARGMRVAARNANDGISLAQTAEGALGKMGDMLQRMRELAVQSSNATNSADDRKALQAEVAQLRSEIDRVAKTTSFNGQKILDGSFAGGVFQVGANAGDNITVGNITNAKANALANVKYGSHTTGVVKADSIARFNEEIDAGVLSIRVGSDEAVQLGAIGKANSGQERLGQVVAAINAKTADTGVTAFLKEGDVAGEFQLELRSTSGEPVSMQGFHAGTTGVGTALTTGFTTANGTAVTAMNNALTALVQAAGGSAAVSMASVFAVQNGAAAGDLAFDADAALPTTAPKAVLTAGLAEFRSTLLAMQSVAGGASAATAWATTNVWNADLSATEVNEAVQAATQKLQASFHEAVQAEQKVAFDTLTTALTTFEGTAVASFATDLGTLNTAMGVANLTAVTQATPTDAESLRAAIQNVIADVNTQMSGGFGIKSADVKDHVGIDKLDISTQSGAWEALASIDSAIDQVNSARADLGALQTRFEKSIENIDIMNENISAARGRIVDADFASETANLSRAQILQQAGTAMVAQANQLPQQVLSLLQ